LAGWGLRGAPDSPELLLAGAEALEEQARELKARGDPGAAALEGEAQTLRGRLAALKKGSGVRQ
jgi:hypothetical protein